MGRSNVAVTIPKPGRVELLERPYPSIVSGYCVIQTEIAVSYTHLTLPTKA